MAMPFIGDIIREVGETVREFIPDADKRDEISVKLAELADRADERENQLLLGQIEVNKEEAKHSNIFVAGWRPFIGWTCGAALGWTWLAAPMIQWVASFWNADIGLPALAPNEITPVVLAMLGVSVSRTVEKVQGVATSMGGKVLKNEAPPPVVVEAKPVVVPAKKPTWFK